MGRRGIRTQGSLGGFEGAAMKVHLESYEVYFATMVGTMRRVEAIRGGFVDRKRKHHEDPEAYWSLAVEGAAAEMAWAKGMNRYWSGGINTFKDGDVGLDQIRHTIRDDGSLIVKPTDNANEVFWLVTGMCPDFIIRGWIRGQEAQDHPEWLRAPINKPAAYFVPQAGLSIDSWRS